MPIAQYRETAIRFEGLKMTRDISQPPINDPHGKPYDLDDPSFPVVKDHNFRHRYWAMVKIPSNYLAYLNEHWDYFNRTRFQGKLQPCTIVLLKDVNAMDMNLRGQWRPRERKLRISPNLFNAPHEGWVNRILLHEMCHQAVWDVDGQEAYMIDHKGSKGHGPLWQGWMRHVHLPPNRFDDQKNIMYFGKDDYKRNEKQLTWQQTLKELEKKYVRLLPGHGRRGTAILMHYLDGDRLGVLVAPDTSSRAAERKDQWWFVNDAGEIRSGPIQHMFILPPDEARPFQTPDWSHKVDQALRALLDQGRTL